MTKIIIIAAIGKNGELVKNNNLIWHLKEDLKFFKEVTTNHIIVMGYNTFKSLPCLLPNRTHIVLTHQKIEQKTVTVFNKFSDVYKFLNKLDKEIFIIGGASLYSQFLPYANEIYLTEIDAEEIEADVYFPKFDKQDFNKIVIKEIEESVNYKFVKYQRKEK